jgi:surface antigen
MSNYGKAGTSRETLEKSKFMKRLFLAAIFAASLVAVFAVPQSAKASGQCYWWWMQNGVKHSSYYDCAHPTKPPWQGGPINPAPGASRHPSTPSSLVHQPATIRSSGTFANTYPWGYCTWWAAQTNLHENLEGLGNAGMWAINARAHGLPVGSTPRVGATAVFAPGVQGAGPLGHVGHVVAVNGSSFEVSEMNYYGGSPPGGFGKVDYRWAYAGGGVSFIY